MLQMNLDLAPPPTMELCGVSQIGTVERLFGDLDKNEQRSGDVLLDLYQQDDQSIRAKVNLKAEWHSLAIEAYRTPGRCISVKGKLMVGNQPRILKDVTDFKIINK